MKKYIDPLLLEEYLEAVEKEKEEENPMVRYRYKVELDKNHAEMGYNEAGDKIYTIFIEGKTYKIKTLTFEFCREIPMTREELLRYVEGTKGIKDLYGYTGSNENKPRNKEEILKEIQESVDEYYDYY